VEGFDIYKDITERTDGDIYAGIVGPVRTGKSTFIKRFMELLVIPNMENSHKKERAKDELPLSGSGRTIMTTEPKFVPNEAVELILHENIRFKVRMVDCVGYLVKGALGHEEDYMPRMVSTPWSDSPMPFEEAAEIGTRKVIKDHSTIGFVITTDGSITDIDRANYIKAEERVVNELKEMEKPFIIIINSKNPNLDSTLALRESLESKYGVSVITMDCLNMEISDVEKIFEKLLYEFPVREIKISLPPWVEGLPKNHWIRENIMKSLKDSILDLEKLNQVSGCLSVLSEIDIINDVSISEIKLGEGVVQSKIELKDGLFYNILKELTGYNIQGDYQILSLITKLSETKKKYDRIEKAIIDAKEIGYGLISPNQEELQLDDPEVYKQGNKYGVRLKASAPTIHLLRADVSTEVAPLVGTEKQSEELLNYFLSEIENEPSNVWKLEIFGKSLYSLVNDELNGKITTLPEQHRQKLRRALEKILNDSSGGLICIII